jgi:hypothetical protein
MKFRTMTVNGMYGSDIEADTAEEAIAKAEGPGYLDKVLDVVDTMEEGADFIIVVAD